MNQQQPDKLFREKLEGYQKQAPASAWDKLEAGLDKKSNKGLWMKVAASLLLVAVAAYLLLSNTQLKSDGGESHIIANNNVVAPAADKEIKTKSVDDNKISNQQSKDTSVEQLGSSKEKLNTSKITVAHAKTESVRRVKEKDSEIDENQVINSVVETPSDVTSSSVTKDAPSVATTSSASTKSKTIVFTVEEVNEKYLNKNAITEATPSEDNPSTLKKLLDKASDLTRDQDPIGELRQKKDEILALNFKKKNVAKTDKPL
jgi:hypothetical protein